MSPPPPGAVSSGLANNLASALCYFTLVAIIFLLIEPYNRIREVRFHAWQSIGLAVGLIVLQVALMIVSAFFGMVSPGLAVMVGLLSTLVSLGGLIVFLYLAFKAYQNQRIVLPVIGPFAEKQA